MENKKVNASVLLCVSFLAAAFGSTLICVLCMGAILFLCKDQELGGQSVEAVVLSLLSGLFSGAADAVLMVFNLIPGNLVAAIFHGILSAAVGIVELAVFVVAIMAAWKILNKEKASIPFLSGKFDGVFVEK